MIETNLRGVREIIGECIGNNQSALLMGSPGIGKSEIIEALAMSKLGGYLCFEASSLDPTDVRGVLMPDGKGNSYYTKSPLLPDVKKHGLTGVINIDELPSGLPAVQVALHPLFNSKERRLGTDVIPKGWIPMATGNYASDGAGAMNLLSALSDRVCVVNVVEDYQIWKEDYALPKNLHPITIGLLNFRSELFSTFKKRVKGDTGKSFATPRTHTEASKVLYAADKGSMSEGTLLAYLAGWLGEGVASELIAFRKTYLELPDIKKIYAGANDIPKEPSVLFAMCSAMVAHLKETKMPIQKAVDRMLEYSLKLEAEFGGLLIRDAYVTYKQNILKSPNWVTVAQRYFN